MTSPGRWQPTEIHWELARRLRAPVPSPAPPPVKPAKSWEGLKVGGCYEWAGRTPTLWEVVDASTAWVHLVPLGATWPRLSLSDPKEAAALRKVRRPTKRATTNKKGDAQCARKITPSSSASSTSATTRTRKRG